MLSFLHRLRNSDAQNKLGASKADTSTCGISFLVFSALLVFGGCASVQRAPSIGDSAPAGDAFTPRVVDFGDESGAKSQTTEAFAKSNKPDDASTHFAMGQAYSLEGNSEKAIEEYKLALVYDGNSPVIHTRLSAEYVKRGLLTFAIDSAKRAVELDSKYLDARLLLAGLYATTKLIPEALAQYDAILKIDANNPEAYVFKGSLLLEENRIPESIAVLNKLVALDQDSFLGFYYLGRAYHQIGDRAKAAQNYKKSLEAKGSFTQAGLALGMLYEEQHETKKAIQAYEDLYQSSGDLQAVARLAQLNIDADNYEGALKYLVLLDEEDKDNLNVKVKIGLIYIERKEFDKAAVVFKKILDANPEAERVRFYYASVLEEKKDYDLAQDEFKKIAASESSSLAVDATLHVAQIYRLQNNMSDAIEWMEKSIAKNPKVSQYVVFKAALLEEQKKVDDAIHMLEKARRDLPRDERVTYYLGSLYDKQGKVMQAIELMQEILEMNPENVHALNYIGYTYATQNQKLDEAEKMLSKARDLRPGDAYVEDSWGYLLMVRGKTKQAITQLEKAVRIKPEEGIILEHLGDAYLKFNLKQKALQKYEEAEKFYVESTDLEKIEKKINDLRKLLGKTTVHRTVASPDTP